MDILVVDDEAGSRSQLTDFLRRAGYSVGEASGGMEALEMIAGEECRLIITDQRMPRMTGIELLDRVRLRSAASIPVIIITAFTDINTVIEAMRAGASDYMFKPVNVAELLVTVERLLFKG
ncbi:MAG: response regulator [Candidatus Saccharibacteria bacterium]